MKTIRDPIHGMMPIHEDEMSIINLPIFQRLRYVKQLTSVELVFPSALHNRFCHCIGAMHLAGMYVKHLELPEKKIKLTRIAALLHDIGHGPFSHIWDRVVYNQIYSEDDVAEGVKSAGHDQHRLYLIKSTALAPHLHKIGINPDDIINIWTNSNPINTVMNMIVQGPLGGDRMDFILRDAYFTGTQHFGTIAYDRIIYSSYIKDDMLCYKTKTVGDIVHALRARQFMYREVYFHETAIAASCLLETVIKLCDIDALIAKTTDVIEFVNLTDNLLFEIAMGTYGVVAAEYAKKYLNRDIKESSDNPRKKIYKDVNMFAPEQFKHIRIDGKLFERVVDTNQYINITAKKSYWVPTYE